MLGICIRRFLLLLRCSLDSKCLKIQQGHATLATILTDEGLSSCLFQLPASTGYVMVSLNISIATKKRQDLCLALATHRVLQAQIIIKSLVANFCASKWYLHSCGFLFLFPAKEGKMDLFLRNYQLKCH